MITFEAKIREQTVRLYASVPLKNGAGAIFRVLADVSRKTNIFNNRFTLNFGWGFLMAGDAGGIKNAEEMLLLSILPRFEML